jgi:hypothetical protein
MAIKLRTAVVSAGVAAVTAAAVFGAAAPAFAKSDAQLTGPRVAPARHSFRLTVSVGDDAGAKRASARLQVLGAHGRYQWLGPSHPLRRTNRWAESYVFTLAESHRGPVTFRAVLNGGYVTTNAVRVVIR